MQRWNIEFGAFLAGREVHVAMARGCMVGMIYEEENGQKIIFLFPSFR